MAALVTALVLTIALLTALSVHLLRAQARLRAEAGHDFLTGLLSRREGMALAEQLLAQGRRHHFPVAAAVVDIDHFKRINDRFGHRAGDAVLTDVAARLRGSLRAGDLAVRLGGEEFAVFLSHATEEQASEAAWRILRGIRLRPVALIHGEVQVTASVGVAQAGRREPVESLLERADRALYEAKASGRDRVRAHSRLLLTASGQ